MLSAAFQQDPGDSAVTRRVARKQQAIDHKHVDGLFPVGSATVYRGVEARLSGSDFMSAEDLTHPKRVRLNDGKGVCRGALKRAGIQKRRCGYEIKGRGDF